MTSELLKKLGEDTIYTAKGHFGDHSGILSRLRLRVSPSTCSKISAGDGNGAADIDCVGHQITMQMETR